MNIKSDIRSLRILLTVIYIICAVLAGSLAALAGYADFQAHKARLRTNSAIMESLANCRAKYNEAMRKVIETELQNFSPHVLANMRNAVLAMRSAFSDARTLDAMPEDSQPILAELSENARRAHFYAQEMCDEYESIENDELAETRRLLLSTLSLCADSLSIFENAALSSVSVSLWPDMKIVIFWIGVCAGFLVFSAGYMIFAFRLTASVLKHSLVALSDGTKELREGNLDYRFREITPDETGQVKYDFNFMARRIAKQSAELQNANSFLRSQAEELIAAHQHKDKFLSNMSHELRTPLNSIIGFSELLGERAEKLPPEKIRSYSLRILTAAEHLLALITSLLDLAKSGAGTLKAVFAEFDLSFAIRDTVEMLRPLAVKKNLEVIVDIQDSISINADSRMIKQIFINLFSNAVKYTPSGKVTIRLRQAENGVCTLDVEDTGIGIEQSEQKNIFKDFHRVDNGPDMMIDGAGIGLALSRRLAKLNNGTLSFTSEYGKGSVFTLTIGKTSGN